MAATINVGGTCTLVRAINAANKDTRANGRCAKGSGADTIVLPRGSTQRLTSVNNDDNGLPVIRSDITIVGNNSTIRRAPTAPEFRLLAVAETGDLTLNRLTLAGGSANSGGGVHNFGHIVIHSSTISGNVAQERGGGVANYLDGTLTVNKSTLSGNTAQGFEGGGLFIAYDYVGSNRVTKRTISGNSASTGGGIGLFSDAVTVVNSTVYGNTASFGGGVSIDSYYNASRLMMTNSTISGNTGGGVGCRYGSGTITNSTLTGNSGGGVVINYCEQGPTLARTIVSGNHADNEPELSTRTAGTLTAASFNLFGYRGLTNGQAFC